MPDSREEAMLDLMREATRALKMTQNIVNEMWAEWTRLHEPTIDRSGPKPTEKVVRRTKRVLR